MELLKSIIVDFCLFSLIEGIIYCYFFEKICKCKKFKLFQILILSLGNCIISQIFIPLIYKIIMVLWMGILLYKINKNIKCFIYPIYLIIIMLVVEMNVFFLYDNFLNIDLSQMNSLNLFFNSLILKTIEIIIIKVIERRNLL